MAAPRTGFQAFVNLDPPPALAGDFASANPRASVGGAIGGLLTPAYRVAPAALVLVGYFAWFDPSNNLAYGATRANSILGFVHRENQTIITDFKGFAREAIQEGFAVTGHTRGDFWAAFPGGAAAGDLVYATAATGAPTTTAGGNVLTPFVVKTTVPADAVVTASLESDDGVLTVTAVTSGAVAAGQFISGTGLAAAANAQVIAQLTGTPGGVGTYQTNYVGHGDVASTAITGTAGKLAKISTW